MRGGIMKDDLVVQGGGSPVKPQCEESPPPQPRFFSASAFQGERGPLSILLSSLSHSQSPRDPEDAIPL